MSLLRINPNRGIASLLLLTWLVPVLSTASAQTSQSVTPAAPTNFDTHAQLAPNETSRGMKLQSVEQMLNGSRNPIDTLRKTRTESAYESQLANARLSDATTSSAESMELNGRASSFTTFCWSAPNFYSRPLYFEQPNFERYDTQTPVCLRPALSYAHFLSSLTILPYKMGVHAPNEHVYTLGHWRPGDVTPHQLHWEPRSARGAAYQATAVTGLIFLIP